ncbi:MAG: hypothetical protein LBB87_00195 [Nitrososphaerota archaeon]|jgi:hypothetical protein|nr:hypothetical protein [Nitrososphaerota archaeon]
MKKLKTGNIVIFAVLLIVIIVVSLFAVNAFRNSHNTENDTSQPSASNTPQPSPQNVPSNAQLNNAGYLEYRDGESKLFLVSANASYGVYSANMPWIGGTFGGQDCFAITATIRSDYTREELQELGIISDAYHSGRVYFAVCATLYEGSSQVSADDVSGAIVGSMSPPIGAPQWCLLCGETDTVEIYMATNNRNIDNYTIEFRILDLSGMAIP